MLSLPPEKHTIQLSEILLAVLTVSNRIFDIINRLCRRWTYDARGLKPHGEKLCYEVPHNPTNRHGQKSYFYCLHLQYKNCLLL
nr:MAG TPA: hypothetical protein [Caudoviricetes sp.]